MSTIQGVELRLADVAPTETGSVSLAIHDINYDPTFYYGSSGGTIFLAGAFMPGYGNVYPGAFAMNCGGTPQNKSNFTWNPYDPAARGSTKLWFTYGDQDFLKDDAHVSAVFYGGLGLPVDETIIAGATHCAFDGHGRALAVWSEFLGE